MSKVWQDLKSEISIHVVALKSELARIYPEDFENETIEVLVKIKDNAKEALVTLTHSANTEAKTELAITLDDSKNLKKRFESVLSKFNLKVK